MIRKHKSLAAIALLALIAFMPTIALAQSPASNAELQRQIAILKAQVEQLQRENQQLKSLGEQVEAIQQKLKTQETQARGQAKSLPVVDASSKGFVVSSPGGDYRMRVGGWIQADGRFYTTGTKPGAGTFIMRRVRPFLDGTVGRFFDFRVMTDFGQGTALLQDAYGDVHYWPGLRLRGGKFKEPVGLERLQDDRYLMLVERALTVNLVPDRDLGLQVHGALFDERVEYRLGLFNGVPDNTAADIDNNDAKDFAGRLFFHPFAGTPYEFAQKLGFGVSGTYGSERGTPLDVYRSAGQTMFFSFNKGVNASGDRFRVSPQANYYYGPLGMQAEFVDNVQQVRLVTPSSAGTRPHTLSNQAWQIAGTYLLTGEDAQYGAPVTPYRNFNPLAGGWGAWELAARVDQLTVDREAFEFGEADPNTSSREAFEYAVGANWYLNENVKLMADYARTSFVWGAAKGHNRTVESTILSEFQVQF